LFHLSVAQSALKTPSKSTYYFCGKKETVSKKEGETIMDEPNENKSRKFSSVICYKISNIMDRIVVEEICSRNHVSIFHVENNSELVRHSQRSLVICDLTKQNKEELDSLVQSSKTMKLQVLGSYPHVSKEIGERALSQGIDYVVPKSGFKRKLEQLLAN